MSRNVRPLAAFAMVALIGLVSAGCSNAPASTAAGTGTGTGADAPEYVVGISETIYAPATRSRLKWEA